MQWTRQQDNALMLAREWYARWLAGDHSQQIFRLFGYAGSGKSTLAQELAEGIDGIILYCAYTGKAAHVLVGKGCAGATTIHRAIYLQGGDPPSATVIEATREKLAAMRREYAATPTTELLEEGKALAAQLNRLEESSKIKGPRFRLNPASIASQAALIVCDECSMVDGKVGRDLLSYGKPVLVMGDPAQLPPVGGGGFFTEHPGDVVLDEVHRQAADSPILWLATQIRNNKPIKYGEYGDALSIVPYGHPSIPERVMAADQMLVGRNGTRHANNAKIRRLKGLTDGTAPPMPVAGDRVICLRNDYEIGVLNGQVTAVTDVQTIDTETVMLSVDGDDITKLSCTAWLHHFQGREKELSPFVKRECQEFAFGYAITVHKAQGSAYDNVVVFDESSSFTEGWRHLYTAVTRAVKRLTLVK